MAKWYVIEKRLSGWSEYLEEVGCLVRSYGHLHKPPLFRGLARSDWRLETSLDRFYPDVRGFLAYYRKVDESRGAGEMLTGKRWDDVPDYGKLCEMARADVDRLTTILTGQ